MYTGDKFSGSAENGSANCELTNKRSLDIEDLSSRLAEEKLNEDDGSSHTRKLGKAKEKRAKKAAQKAATDSTLSEVGSQPLPANDY